MGLIRVLGAEVEQGLEPREPNTPELRNLPKIIEALIL